MAIFTKKPEPEKVVKAAAGSNAGASQIGNFFAYSDGVQRSRFMQVPTISRSRDLMASLIGCLPLVMYKTMWNGDEM